MKFLKKFNENSYFNITDKYKVGDSIDFRFFMIEKKV